MKIKLIPLLALAAIQAVADPMTNAPASATNQVPVSGTNAAPAVVTPAPDPMVGRVLMALGTTLQSARTFRCQVMFRINSEMEGMKQEISASYTLAAERPNRLSLRFVKGMTGNTVVCDGKKIITYAVMLNRYEEKDAPGSFEQFSQGMGPMAGNILFVDNLLRDDIYAAIMDGVVKAAYVGRTKLDGQECDHLKFEQDQFDWELWVTTGPKPVVLQVVYDMAKSFTAAGGDPVPARGMKMTVVNRFSDWVVDGDIQPGTFEFKPPAGAHKAESLFEGEDDLPGLVDPVVPGTNVETNATPELR